MTPSQIKLITEDVKPVFSYNSILEKEYNQILNSVVKTIRANLKKFNPNDPATAIEVMKALQNYTNKLYGWSKKRVGGLIYNLNTDSIRKWLKHSAIISQRMRQEIKTVPVKPLLEQFLMDNVGLIQSMPLRAAQKVQKVVVENLQTGQYRAEGLVDQIMNIGKVTENRAKLIARTEISRMSTELIRVRSEAVDMNWYIWKTSHDVRVRGSHRLMDKVLVNWSEPPSPERLDHQNHDYGNYNPGQIFNCRCYPQPLVRIDDINWPAKVYHNGSIVRMRKADFARLSQGQVPL